MKLSLKFREETHHQNPLLRAKIPVAILGLPFLSGVTAGDAADLSFSLRSNFPSGPSLSLSYHPTNTSTKYPFSLSLKSGIGTFGSPHDSPLVFTANFNPFSPSSSTLNPSFTLQVKPQFGNFSLFKSVDSSSCSPIRANGQSSNGGLTNGSVADFGISNGLVGNLKPQFENISLKPVDSSSTGAIKVSGQSHDGEISNGLGSDFVVTNGLGHGSGEPGSKSKPLAWRDLKREGSLFSGIFVAARTSVPLTKRAVVNFRWGVNFPPPESRGSKSGLPVLVMNKISLERVEEVRKEEEKGGEEAKARAGDLELLKGMCSWMKREMDDLQRENREIRRAFEGMRVPVPASRGRGEERESVGKRGMAVPEGLTEFDKWRSKKGNGNGGVEESGNRESKKLSSRASEVENELQKAIMAASS